MHIDDVGAHNLVARRFGVEGPDRLWLTDITEHATGDGKLYCAAAMDAYSRRIIGWSIDERQGLYRSRTRHRDCDLRFGRMSRLRQDRG